MKKSAKKEAVIIAISLDSVVVIILIQYFFYGKLVFRSTEYVGWGAILMITIFVILGLVASYSAYSTVRNP